jgi:hypothetical protein
MRMATVFVEFRSPPRFLSRESVTRVVGRAVHNVVGVDETPERRWSGLSLSWFNPCYYGVLSSPHPQKCQWFGVHEPLSDSRRRGGVDRWGALTGFMWTVQEGQLRDRIAVLQYQLITRFTGPAHVNRGTVRGESGRGLGTIQNQNPSCPWQTRQVFCDAFRAVRVSIVLASSRKTHLSACNLHPFVELLGECVQVLRSLKPGSPQLL